jgi:hypothetical protein
MADSAAQPAFHPRRAGIEWLLLEVRTRSEAFDRALCLLFALGDHADEAAVAHHSHDTRMALDLFAVEREQLGVLCRRPQHATVQHARSAHVVHERSPAEDLGCEVDALRSHAADADVL